MATLQEIVGHALFTDGMAKKSGDAAVIEASEAAVAKLQAFRTRPGDVIICTYRKSGTTWCQQLCHQLRTGGDTDFDEISDEGVVPFMELAGVMDLDAPQSAEPRCFKTHHRLQCYSHLEGARFLCVVRNPEDTLRSEFNFHNTLCGWRDGDASAADINAFLSAFPLPADIEGTIFDYYVDFWRCKGLPNVLVLAYEHLLADLDAHLAPIAAFMGLPEPTPELRAKVRELCSKEWMSSHVGKFDDHNIFQRKGKGEGKVAPKVGLARREGVNYTINDETRERIEQMWRDVVLPATGCASYAELLANLRPQPAGA